MELRHPELSSRERALREGPAPRLRAVAASLLARGGRLHDRGYRWLTSGPRSLYGLAMTRILLGVVGLGVLLTNFGGRHYSFGTASSWNGELAEPTSDFPRIWLFSAFRATAESPALFTALYLSAIVAALMVTVGLVTRPAIAVHLVLWVSLIETNDSLSDQSDNAYRIFLVLLLLTRCADRWSLDARLRDARPGRTESLDWLVDTVHNLALIALVFQVCAIYVAGGFYKLAGEAWQHGYAAYLPLQTAQFGTWPVLSELVTAWGPGVAVATWGSILVQIYFPFLLLRRRTRAVGLVAIMTFHGSIGLLMGIPWFSLAMIAVDAVFIRDSTYQALSERVGRSLRPRVETPPAARPESELIDA